MIAVRAKLVLVVLGVLTVQASLLSGPRAAGIHTDAMLLVPICAGIVAGPERGAVMGFVAGLVADLFLLTPLGLSALTFSVLGFAVGTMQGNVIRATWWITPITALVASAVGITLYALAGAVVGQGHLVRPELGVIALSVSLVNAALSIPVVRAVKWALAGDVDRAYAH